jgi:DNA-binding transcriptional regulator YdaS (Cro superfamily)
MTKTEAVSLFGSQSKLADAIGVTRSYVSQWPEELEPRIADRILGAAVRLGKIVPVLAPATEVDHPKAA